MKILNKFTTHVIETVYTIQDEASTFFYKECCDESGEVIDAMLMDKNGNQLNDYPVLLEMVQEIVDQAYDQDMLF